MEQQGNDVEENDVQTEYYDPVAILLSGINHETQNLTNVLRKCGVTYDQLSGLVEEDLQLMGMTNSNAIEEVLSEISQLSKQRRMYDSVLRNEFDPSEYVQTVCKHSEEHLAAMKLMLNLIHVKLMLSFPNNLLLDDRFYASEWSLKLCEKIYARLDGIQSVVDVEKKGKTRKSALRKIGVSVIILSGAIILTIFCRHHCL